MTMDQDLPRKGIRCRQVYLLSRSLKERWGGRHNNEQSCQKQRKNPRQTWKMCWGARNESTYSFQNYDSWWLLMLLYQAGTCIKKRNLVFNIMYGKFWFDGEFFVRNLDASMKLRQYQSLSQRNSLFLTECYSFFLLCAYFFPFFFTEDFLPLLIFPWPKIFS